MGPLSASQTRRRPGTPWLLHASGLSRRSTRLGTGRTSRLPSRTPRWTWHCAHRSLGTWLGSCSAHADGLTAPGEEQPAIISQPASPSGALYIEAPCSTLTIHEVAFQPIGPAGNEALRRPPERQTLLRRKVPKAEVKSALWVDGAVARSSKDPPCNVGHVAKLNPSHAAREREELLFSGETTPGLLQKLVLNHLHFSQQVHQVCDASLKQLPIQGGAVPAPPTDRPSLASVTWLSPFTSLVGEYPICTHPIPGIVA